MSDESLYKQVKESLNNATENGYDMMSMSISEIVNDLLWFDSTLENCCDTLALIHCVERWKDEKRLEISNS